MEDEWEAEQSKVEAKEETTPLWRDLEAVEKWLNGAQQEVERLSTGADALQASQQFDHLFTDAKVFLYLNDSFLAAGSEAVDFLLN